MKIAIKTGLLAKWYVNVDSGHVSYQLSVINYQDCLLILVVFRIENKILPISSAFSNKLLKFSISKSPLSFNECNQYLVSKHSF